MYQTNAYKIHFVKWILHIFNALTTGYALNYVLILIALFCKTKQNYYFCNNVFAGTIMTTLYFSNVHLTGFRNSLHPNMLTKFPFKETFLRILVVITFVIQLKIVCFLLYISNIIFQWSSSKCWYPEPSDFICSKCLLPGVGTLEPSLVTR